tara:strand:- start:361 stop:762 length:402 start_codon:yes stop_codon:yes gene_type:complete
MQAVTIERTWKLKDGQETHIVAGDLVTIHQIYAYAHTTMRDPTYGWGLWFCLKTIFAPDDYFETIPFKKRISKAREHRRKLFATWHTRRRTHYDFEAIATVDGKFETFLWDEFCDELMYEIWEEVATEHKIAA